MLSNVFHFFNCQQLSPPSDSYIHTPFWLQTSNPLNENFSCTALHDREAVISQHHPLSLRCCKLPHVPDSARAQSAGPTSKGITPSPGGSGNVTAGKPPGGKSLGVNRPANELSCRRLWASFSKTEGAHGKRERDSRRMLACEGTRGRVWERYMLRRGGRVCLGHGGENGGGREVSGRWGIRCLCSQSSARKGIRFLFRSRCRRRRLNWRGRRCGRFRGRGLCRRNGRS